METVRCNRGRLGALVISAVLMIAQAASGQVAQPGGHGDPGTIDVAGLYTEACAPCHGRAGDGNGRGVRLLGAPRPRDFTTGVFEFRSTAAYELPTDEDLYRTIVAGIPGTWMPGWEALLQPVEVWALVSYLKGFSPVWTETEPSPALHVPDPPAESADLVAEGQMVYAVLECWRCHGPSGRGDGPSAGELKDDWDRSIRPYDFTTGNYKRGSTASDVYRTFVTGLSGTPMPALEPHIVAFPGGRDAAVADLRSSFGEGTADQVADYLAQQPDAERLAELSDEELGQLVQVRLWALVFFVRSLERSPGALERLFGENPDLTGRTDR